MPFILSEQPVPEILTYIHSEINKYFFSVILLQSNKFDCLSVTYFITVKRSLTSGINTKSFRTVRKVVF